MKCPKCGFENDVEAKICSKCGAEISVNIQPPEGRRLITVLFIELTGFNKLEQEDISTIINFYLEHLTAVITKHSGTVYRCEGNFIISLYGVPVIYEDDPERAVKTSLEMMDALSGLNNTMAQKLRTKVDVGLRIGINSGVSIIRLRGTDVRSEYMVIGNTIDIAAELAGCAKPGEVIVSEPIFIASRYLFDYDALPAIPVKGTGELTNIYKPLRIKEKPDPKYGVKGLYSPLVGRKNELELLYQKVSALQEGKGGAVFILGDVGIGKSRLWIELKEMIINRQLPITIFESSCLSYGEVMSNWLFLQILRVIFDIYDTDDLGVIQEKLVKKTKEIFPVDWEKIVPYIAYLFSIRLPGGFNEHIRHLDPQALKLQIMLSVKDMLFALAKNQPLLFVIDDYQWIDPASLGLLEFILGSIGQPTVTYSEETESFFPFLFLCLSRIEKEKEFWKSKRLIQEKLGEKFSEIVLAPLDQTSGNQLISNLLKVHNIPEEFKNKLLDKTEGNPFYLEEILRSLIYNNIIVYDAGIWNLKRQISAIKIPDAIQTAIVSRMDRLGKEARNILEMAAVIGRVFYESVLECLTGIPRLTLSIRLMELEEFEYIKVVKRGPEVECVFKHPLVQEVIYNTLSRERLKELHRKVAECVEKIFSRVIVNFTELLSHQYYMAEDWARAYEYSIKSAKKAKDIYLNKEAIWFYDRALKCIRVTESESSEILQRRAMEAIRDKVDVLYLMAENEKALSLVNKGLTIAKKINDKKFEADFLLWLSDIYGAISAYNEMLTSAQEANSIYQEIGDKKGQAECLNNIGVVYNNLGNFDKALEYYNESLKIHEEINDDKGAAICLNNIGYVYNNFCKYEEAFNYYNKSCKILEKINDRKGTAISLENIGSMYSVLGNYSKALEYHNNSLKIKEEIGDRWGVSVSFNNIGYVYGILGDYAAALEYHNKSLRIKTEIGDRFGESISFKNIGYMYSVFGDYIKAFDYYSKALEISEKINNRVGVATNLNGIGSLFILQEKITEAREYLMKTEKVVKEIDNKELLRKLAVSFAELELLQNDTDKAKNYAESALKFAEELKLKSGRAEALLLLARIETANSRWQIADSRFKEAISIFEEQKQLLELAKSYYYYAECQKMCNKQKKAREYKQKAKEIFERIGAKSWLCKAKNV